MSILVDFEIQQLATNENLISPFELARLQGASYDMRIGRKYIHEGVSREMKSPETSIRLEPGQFVILSTFETLSLPQDLVGHNGLMSDWAKQGLVCLFGAQIDPGFKGRLFVPLFNAGDGAVLLQLNSPFFTVEFIRTSKPAKMNWSERNGNKKLAGTTVQTPSATRPTLADFTRMQEALLEVRSSQQKLEQLMASVNVRVSSVESQNSFKTSILSCLSGVIGILLVIVAFEPVNALITRFFSADEAASKAADIAPGPRDSADLPQK